jgi:hypothetical protein
VFATEAVEAVEAVVTKEVVGVMEVIEVVVDMEEVIKEVVTAANVSFKILFTLKHQDCK